MRRFPAIALCLVLVSACIGFCPCARADDAVEGTQGDPILVTVSDLISASAVPSGAYVTFQGEVVGDLLDGDDADHKWINIDEDDSVIGVYIEADQAEGIVNYGRYGVTGDTVTVTGVYHPACTEGHSGELDVHADSVEVLTQGGPHAVSTSPWKRWVFAGVTMAIALVLLAIYYHRKKQAIPA